MKCLRILLIAGLCSCGTTAITLADEIPGNDSPLDVSEGPVDDKPDDAGEATQPDPAPASPAPAHTVTQRQAVSPHQQKETGSLSGHPDNNESPPEVRQEERWVLGIQCDAADALLRKHLKLGSAGLVILQVKAETPAAESDLQPGDLITRIDDNELTCRDDLIKAVTNSNGAGLDLTVLREGEARKIQVTPRRMMVPVLMSPATSKLAGDEDGNEEKDTRESKIFQGVLIQGAGPFDEIDLEEMDVEALVRQVRELTAKELESGGDGSTGIVITIPDGESPAPLSEEQLRQNIAVIKDHIQLLQKKLATMEWHLKDHKAEAP